MHFFLIRTVLLAQMAFFHKIQQKTAITTFHVGIIHNNQSIHTIHEKYKMALKDHNWIFPRNHAIDLPLYV